MIGLLLIAQLCAGVPSRFRGDASCKQSPDAGASLPDDEGAALCLTGKMEGLSRTATLMVQNLLPSLEEDGLPVDIFLYGPTPTPAQWSRLGLLLETGRVRASLFTDESGLLDEIKHTHSKVLEQVSRIGGNWWSSKETSSGKNRTVAPGSLMMYGQEQCLRAVKQQEARRGRRYRTIVHSRSDLKWIFPHPPLTWLGSDFAWVPAGWTEDFGGIYDKHYVLPRGAAEHVLGSWSHLLSGCAVRLLTAMMSREALGRNQTFPEKWLKVRLQTAASPGGEGRLRVARFPLVGYISCDAGDVVRKEDYRPNQPLHGPFVCSKEDDARYVLEHEWAIIVRDCLRDAGGWNLKAAGRCFCPVGWSRNWSKPAFGFDDVFELCDRSARGTDQEDCLVSSDLTMQSSTHAGLGHEATRAAKSRVCITPQ